MAYCLKRTIIGFFSYNILKTIHILFCNVSTASTASQGKKGSKQQGRRVENRHKKSQTRWL
nr:hypothetical protein [Cronobacter turicensis]